MVSVAKPWLICDYRDLIIVVSNHVFLCSKTMVNFRKGHLHKLLQVFKMTTNYRQVSLMKVGAKNLQESGFRGFKYSRLRINTV